MSTENGGGRRAAGAEPAEDVDYVVIGSGAGGGPLAANLACAGFTVALLEAGGADAPAEYEVPAFFTRATEHPDMRWDFYVRHYSDGADQKRDSKYVPQRDGILYPRSGTLGGCTAHHAMITTYPHASDWDRIAELMGDPSWRAEAMEAYFRRLEACRFLKPLQRRPLSRHGHGGWLPTAMGDIRLVFRDWQVLRIALSAVSAAAAGRFWSSLGRLGRAFLRSPMGPLEFLKRYFDPNDRPHAADETEGVYFLPISVDGVRRMGVRQRILDVAARHPERLLIRTHALATRVLFDGERRAVGVEYLSGRHLYRASPLAGTAAADPGEVRRVRARREVIVAAGAFNSPQILMLSGVGPRVELERHGIAVIADRPGVGRNLQDRYEVAVVNRTKSPFRLTRGATFRAPGPGEEPDPLYAEWLRGKGPYGTNGSILALVRRSRHSPGHPDLIGFAVPGLFRGYFPGYSTTIAKERDYFSWVILKSHVRNRAGFVRLASADPTEPPHVEFRYFHEGTGGGQEDLEAVTEAIQFFRSVAARTRRLIAEEVVPGPKTCTADEIRQFVRDEAWGHHASCSNRIGPPDDSMSVVDSAFRVYGVERLRVVDASVFPRIPGFFIVTAVYMISEKASDMIIADATAGPCLAPGKSASASGGSLAPQQDAHDHCPDGKDDGAGREQLVGQ